MTAAGTDACTVRLTAAAPTGGITVRLTSSDGNVRLPGSVTVPAGSISAGFTAIVSAVAAPQSSTLTATAGNVSRVSSIALGPSKATTAPKAAAVSTTLSSISCQSSYMTRAGTDACTVRLTVPAPAGGVTVRLTSSDGNVKVPGSVTVASGSTTAGFTAIVSAVTASQSSTLTATAGNVSRVSSIALGPSKATAVSTTLSSISCQSNYMTTAGTDACSVRLTAAAPAGGVTVRLTSTDGNVKVPGSVTVASGSASAGFSASVSAVTGPQSSTLTATAGNVSRVCSIALGPSKTAALSLNTSSLSFGNVPLKSPATQPVVLTASGAAPLTVTAATLTGTGFTLSGPEFPLTLNPGQKATLDVEFAPAQSGNASATLAISSSAGSKTILVSGTGVAQAFGVNLIWDAPSGSGSIAGYNIYRATKGSPSYLLLNTSVDASTSYEDKTVQTGASYDYTVESVGTDGAQSAPSNVFSVTVQ